MELVPNIRRASAGRRPCARRLTATLAMLLAFAVHLIAPPAVEAASNGDVGSTAGAAGNPSSKAGRPLPSAQSSHLAHKQPCAILLSAHLDEGSKSRNCQEPPDGSSGSAVPVIDLNPAHAAGDALGAAGDVVDTVTGGVADAVTGKILDGFKAIIGFLFGGLQSAITVALIKWIATVPNLSDGHVGDLEASIAVGAGGLLAATMTISIVRFWGSGLTGDGAWAGAEGVARAAVAATLIGLWPQIFDLAVRLSNALQHGILDEAVQAQLKALFRDLDVIGLGGGAAVGLASGVISGGLVPLFLAIVIAIVGMLMLLALVAMKIVITALTIVLFCAMPLALVLWPIPELSGLAKLCLRSLGVALAIPVIWCLVFGAFAAIGADTFSFHNTGKDEDFFGTALNVTIVRPLVAISLLYLALVLPRRLLQMAPLMGGGRAGFGRALATGATLRAGFHYGPQAGRMALDRAQSIGAVQSMGARFGKGAAGGTRVDAGATQANNAPSKDPSKSGPKSPASSLRDSSAQAPTGRQNQSKGTENAMGESSSTAAQMPKGQAASGSGKSAMAANGSGPLRLAGGELNGPETIEPSDAKNEEIAQRRKEMSPRSKSEKAVTAGQIDGAIASLQSQPEFVQASRNASSPSTNPKLATGAFAEWSLSDNPAVTDTHRDAFNILGQASPRQREMAFDRLDSIGGGGSAGSSKGNGRGSRSSDSSSGEGRRVPVRDQSTSPPPPPRTMPRQPGQNGGT